MVLVDDGRWPLVVVHWPAGPLQPEALETVLRGLGGFYGRRHAILHDGLGVTGIGPAERRRLMQHSNAFEAEIRASVVASAAVIGSTLWRGIIILIQRVAPTPSPFRTFSTYAAGEEWLLQALRRAGLWRPEPPPLPPPGPAR
jgi:hypothetical protein